MFVIAVSLSGRHAREAVERDACNDYTKITTKLITESGCFLTGRHEARAKQQNQHIPQHFSRPKSRKTSPCGKIDLNLSQSQSKLNSRSIAKDEENRKVEESENVFRVVITSFSFSLAEVNLFSGFCLQTLRECRLLSVTTSCYDKE